MHRGSRLGDGHVVRDRRPRSRTASRSIVDEGEFDAERWYGILEDQQVSVWYTAPTAVRMMMKVGADAAREHRLPRLRFIASVGEPLNPEAVRWGEEAFGLPIHDNWWQTETGGIMIANFAAMDIRPGSMGRPLPGIDAAILRRDEHGHVVVRRRRARVVEEPMVEGELALRRGWPSMFRGYLGEAERYEKCFAGDWYLSGDLAMRDADGYFWFVGRGDDVIKSAGHLIGPFEVESALMEHPAVAEAGVIGKPDPVAGELVKAFVVLRPGSRADRRSCDSSSSGSAGPGSGGHRAQGARVPRATFPRRAAARSCAGCSGPASSVCPKATCRPWRRTHDTRRSSRGPRASPLPRDAADPPVRGALRRAVQRGEDPRVHAPLHRRGGRRRRRHAGARRRTTRSSRPIASTGTPSRGACRRTRSWPRCSARSRAAAAVAAARCISSTPRPASTAATPSSAAAYRSRSGWRSPTECRATERVTACFFGEGAVAEGEFHESMNLAALWNLPVLFCCENNLYAMGTALERSESETDLTLKAASYEMPAWSVDGMDVLAVETAARRAVEAVRSRRRPALPRVPHVPVPRALDVRPGALPREGRGRSVEATRSARALGTAAAGRGLRRRRRARRRSKPRSQPRSTPRSRSPRPARSSRSRISRASSTTRPRHDRHRAPDSHDLPRGDARGDPRRAPARSACLRHGRGRRPLRRLLRGDKGLLDEFGPERIRDTPLSESAFVGAGIGAALGGMRPIVEIMTVNFSLLALDQILNNAATLQYMSGGQFHVPLVIRMTTGAGRQLAAQHSHSLEGWYAHIPGIKMLTPATIDDAYGMLAARARRSRSGAHLRARRPLRRRRRTLGPTPAVDIEPRRRPPPRRATSRSSRTAARLPKVLAAAEQLATDGIDAEVVDLRVLRPLDTDTILASVRRTRRVVVVDEAWRSGGISAEVSARITEHAFFDLDAPVARVCSAEVPMPYAKHLEDAALPQVAGIVAAARQVIRADG